MPSSALPLAPSPDQPNDTNQNRPSRRRLRNCLKEPAGVNIIRGSVLTYIHISHAIGVDRVGESCLTVEDRRAQSEPRISGVGGLQAEQAERRVLRKTALRVT